MVVLDKSILLIGESDVGKSHYGAQLLKRLMQEDGRIRMHGAPTNLQPFEAVMARLDAGLSADHTATSVYHESHWPIVDDQGRNAHLIWPDYGGEQVKNIIDGRQLPHAWLTRIADSSAWLLMIRLQTTRANDDVFTRPLTSLKENSKESRDGRLSDQTRLIELLQILLYAHSTSNKRSGQLPRFVVLLTCWDEMESSGIPIDLLHERLPMFADFVASNWKDYSVLGLSALGRSLDKENPDEDYIAQGSERFGYVILDDATPSPDLTLPILKLLAGST
ncbi:MAG: hypothetical protein OXS40_10965 [Gammaproteobacteria bacterium]|nr:hypothetical protein [Gammaproteobacteria bacterium]